MPTTPPARFKDHRLICAADQHHRHPGQTHKAKKLGVSKFGEAGA
jgi:hypothetical protein